MCWCALEDFLLDLIHVSDLSIAGEQETRCFDALAELYGMLNEEDVLFGLWKRRGAAEETRAALSCIQHGMLQQGQDYLLDAIRKAANNQFPPPAAGLLETSSTCRITSVFHV